MSKITYYFATISPYTYLAGTRLEKMAAATGAAIDYRPVDIMGLFARTGGTPPKDRHINRQEWRIQELTRQAKILAMPLNLRPAHWPTNMAPSSYAFISAKNHGSGGDLGALAFAFCRACWAEDKDIAQPDVIAACLSDAGFDPSLADKDMIGAAEEYSRNLDDAVADGAFGAPFYVTQDGQRFWGQDRINDLGLHLQGAL
ncbi:MAG: 2-hydroxychromene-2-carboxylate isomerase [Pseudomonadota bacterium]